MQGRQLIISVAGAATVISWGLLWWLFRPATPQIDATPLIGRNTGLGVVLAEETIKAVHDRGRIVLVTPHDRRRGVNWRDDCWKAFQQALAQHPGITIAATEIAQPNPAEYLAGSCPLAAFQDILQRHAGVDAIVFFLGLPDWNRASPSLPASVSAKILVVDDSSDGLSVWQYGGYLEQGLVTALLYSKDSSSKDEPPQPKTPREWFDRYFSVYTAQNYKSLPRGATSASP